MFDLKTGYCDEELLNDFLAVFLFTIFICLIVFNTCIFLSLVSLDNFLSFSPFLFTKTDAKLKYLFSPESWFNIFYE